MFRIRNDVNYENERQIKNCPECPKPKYKSNNPNQRIIIVNGKSYNNITECCRELKITRTYLYEKMKAKGIDKNVMDNIQKLIEEILKK
jgi:transcriptional regulator with PAS, ATPase and Fis domain